MTDNDGWPGTASGDEQLGPADGVPAAGRAGRVLWGSDHALDNNACEIVKVRTCGLTPGEQEWVLGHTALRVYDRIRTG